MIQYNFFHRNFVLRMATQFTRPPLPLVTRFELPVMAMVHHVSPSATSPWPSEDMLFYQNNIKPLRISHHTTLVELKGNPRLIPGDINSQIRKFRTDNPRFRPAIDVEAMKREPKTIITHNYGLLLTRYKYQRNLFTFHNRWNNIFATLFQTIGENVKTGYHQYIELTLPQQLPARSVLDKSLDGWTTRNMGIFNSYEMIFLHHLWAWMGERRDVSMMHKYIPDMTGVKLILREADRFTVIDMSLLEEWRKPSTSEKKEYDELRAANGGVNVVPLKKGTFTPSELQRVFLRLLMSVMELRNKDLPESLGDEDADQVTTPVLDDQAAAALATDTDGDSNTATAVSATQDEEVTEEKAYAGYDGETDKLNLLAEIDKDLEALEITGLGDENAPPPFDPEDPDEAEIAPPVHETAPEQDQAPVVKEIKYFPVGATEAFQTLLARAAESGAVTAAEYRRLMEASERFNSLEAPLNQQGLMKDFIKVPNELVRIDAAPQIPDQATIVDKSMLKSTLLHWNERYSREVMQRDIAGMVSQLQAAGVMISNYDVEEVEDITGTHYEYTIQVKPIEGAASTLSMKIPKVDDEGNFKINGVNYRMRMQRGDGKVPIV